MVQQIVKTTGKDSKSFSLDSLKNILINLTKLRDDILPEGIESVEKLWSKVNGFSKLKSNWDSYGADAISRKAIQEAFQTLIFLRDNGLFLRQFELNVFPMRDGGVQFEFDSDILCAELEINSKGELNFIQYDSSGNILNFIAT